MEHTCLSCSKRGALHVVLCDAWITAGSIEITAKSLYKLLSPLCFCNFCSLLLCYFNHRRLLRLIGIVIKIWLPRTIQFVGLYPLMISSACYPLQCSQCGRNLWCSIEMVSLCLIWVGTSCSESTTIFVPIPCTKWFSWMLQKRLFSHCSDKRYANAYISLCFQRFPYTFCNEQ